ncbi:hypothetical protein PALB_970 [Pseudoalteromonas luteoviolacea B = ATCC 29581]|nr:hypothetical protein PALB_970 [Pseudoalteromonas luteoviolacea B = ATCC 29581]
MLTNKKTLLAVSIVSALTLTACGSDNDDNVVVPPPVVTPPPPPPPVIVVPEAPEEIAFLATVTLVNASTGELISSAVKVDLYEGDTLTNKVTDVDGNAITSITTEDGLLNFSVKTGESPNLRAVLTAEGFVPSSATLDLTDTSADFEGSISLAPVTGAGVEAAQETAAVSAGQVAVETKVATSAEAEATAEVVVPAGTTMQDANGNAVSGTSVTMKVQTAGTSGSATKAAVGDMIPAGLNTATETNVRKPLSVANIEMVDNNGNKIKKFSSPITVTLEVPESAGVKTGDKLKVSSYDEATAKWTKDEFEATIGAFNATKKSFAANFKTDHLTLFTTTKEEQKCGTANVITMDPGNAAAPGLKISIVGNNGEAIRNATSLSSLGQQATAKGLAANAVGVVTVQATGLQTHTSPANTNVCGYAVPQLQPAAETPVSASITVNFQCSNAGAAAPAGMAGAKVQARLGTNVVNFDGNGGVYTSRGNSILASQNYRLTIEPRGEFKGATTTANLNGVQINGQTILFTKQCNEGTSAGG